MSIKHRVIHPEIDGKTVVVTLTARKAIQRFCWECVGFNKADIRGCTAINCPLFPFRTRDTPVSTV